MRAKCAVFIDWFEQRPVERATGNTRGGGEMAHLQGMIFWFWFFGRFSGFDPWRVECPSTLHAVCQQQQQQL